MPVECGAHRHPPRSPPMDKLAAFDIIRAARSLVKDVNTSASEKTLAQYRAGYQRMIARGLTPEKMANTVRSFYFYRAAHVHHFASSIREELRLSDKAQRNGDQASFLEGVARIETLCSELERYRPDPSGKHLAAGKTSKWAVEAEKRKRTGIAVQSHSKRSRLRGLPVDWRERMFATSERSKYREAIAVLALTGARPAEIECGVSVALSVTGSLVFNIQGKKTHGGKFGQEMRVLEVLPQSPDAIFLVNRVKAHGPLMVKADAGALSDRVRMIGKSVFPRLKECISCYVYRHQFAADLKKSGMSGVDVSAALGHCADETKRYYGAAQSGLSGNRLLSVKGTTPVREKTMQKIRSLEGRRREYERER